jgi:hypothetical protein
MMTVFVGIHHKDVLYEYKLKIIPGDCLVDVPMAQNFCRVQSLHQFLPFLLHSSNTTG